MASYSTAQIAQILKFAADSSDDDDDKILPSMSSGIIPCEEDDDYDILRVLQPVIGRIQRMEHIKSNDYVENIARNYIDNDFVIHFRLSREISYELIDRFAISDIFTSLQAHAGFEPITPEKHILCFLWFVGHEKASYRTVAEKFGITLSTLHMIITRVTNFLMEIAPGILRFPTQEEREVTKEYYQRELGVSGVIGSVDGSHIRINKPLQDKNSYINRKKFFSIKVQGLVDQKMKFLDVCIGFPGSVHDARVFRESSLYNTLDDICGEDGFILGDGAYPCLPRLIVPYRDNGQLTYAQTNFNNRLSSCHEIVRHAFICLKQRFRQLYHLKLRDIVRKVQVVHACCVLHNLADSDDLESFEAPLDDDYREVDAAYAEPNEHDYFLQDTQLGSELRDEICRQLAT